MLLGKDVVDFMRQHGACLRKLAVFTAGPLLAAAPGPAAMASGSARFAERQARLGLHQIDELAYAEVFLQFRVLSITNFPSVIRIK